MKERWLELVARFTALQRREKIAVATAVVFAVVVGGFGVWVDPAQRRMATLQKQLTKDKMDAQTLQAQIAGMQSQLRDPDEANRKALADVAKQLESLDASLREFDHVLVSPTRAPRLLQSLLARHRGLELVSVQTLPAEPLLSGTASRPAQRPDEVNADGRNVAVPTLPPVKGENIMKHPIEIKIVGSYADLLAYVAELEQLSQKLLWDSMVLSVQQYPKSELTLTVSTLSLDSVWLVF